MDQIVSKLSLAVDVEQVVGMELQHNRVNMSHTTIDAGKATYGSEIRQRLESFRYWACVSDDKQTQH